MVNSVARPKITVYIDNEVYQWLIKRAKKEVRSPANLAEFLLNQSYEQEKKEKKEK